MMYRHAMLFICLLLQVMCTVEQYYKKYKTYLVSKLADDTVLTTSTEEEVQNVIVEESA